MAASDRQRDNRLGKRRHKAPASQTALAEINADDKVAPGTVDAGSVFPVIDIEDIFHRTLQRAPLEHIGPRPYVENVPARRAAPWDARVIEIIAGESALSGGEAGQDRDKITASTPFQS